MKSAPTLAFVTLGCPKNQVDSESMLGLLVRDGFRTVADPAQADVAVVNTCAFLQSAVRESRETIAQVAALKQSGRLKAIDRRRMPGAARRRDAALRFP